MESNRKVCSTKDSGAHKDGCSINSFNCKGLIPSHFLLQLENDILHLFLLSVALHADIAQFSVRLGQLRVTYRDQLLKIVLKGV